MKEPKITIGFNKDGEADFEIRAFDDMTLKEMDELRVMCMVAIGVAEQEYRRHVGERLEAQTDQS